MVDLDNENLIEPVLDPDRQRQAKEYARTGRYLSFAEIVVVAVFLALLAFGGFSERLTWYSNLPVIPAAILYFLILVAAYRLLTSPISYYGGYVLPRRYGLSKQSLSGWLGDLVKAGALTLVLGIAIVAIVYWLIIVQPQLWWLFCWGFLVLFSLVMSVLAPVLLVPIFFKMKPLEDGELRDRLEKLAKRVGVEIGGIYTIEFSSKSTTANAALMGMDRTKRIVLSDTLLNKYSASEIEVIMAHEMAHSHHRDMLRLFVFQSVILLVNLYAAGIILNAVIEPLGFSGLSDISALPLLALIFAAINLLLSPITTGYGRRIETEADGYALELTNDPFSFISAMARLTEQNLAEADPNHWVEMLLHDHPSYRSRLAHARRFAESKQDSK
ncbi:MAG: M48 family metallopeptidase [Chloroflexota bacterium]